MVGGPTSRVRVAEQKGALVDMGMYKAHKPLVEIRTTAVDWYNNRLWFSIDNRQKGCSNTVLTGYSSSSIKTFKKYKICRDYYFGVEQYLAVDFKNACTDADKLRLKLTNSGQRCKIFKVYRRPHVSL